MRRYHFNKLVRSNLPTRMIDEGVLVNSRALSSQEYIEKLKEKIIEESKEVVESDTRENLVIELADLVEVIHSLAKAQKIDIEEIERARLEKSKINGHFSHENYINHIDVAEDNLKVIEYLDNKNRHYINQSSGTKPKQV